MKNLNLILSTLVFCFLFSVLGLSEANAQETQRTITIVPPTVQKAFDPGDKTEGIMKVINDSSEPLTFTASVQDFIVQDTIGTPNILPPNSLNKQYSAASWIGVAPSTFTVLPHEKQILNYYIQIPLDARPGGHYAAVLYSPTNPAGVQGTGASVKEQIGTLFYIAINGPIKEQSLVAKFGANSFQEYGPVKILTQIKNLGDLHVKPQGAITISDLLGRTIQSDKLSQFNIFPQTARDYENTFGQNLMIGRFKATLLASYGRNNNLPLVATVYFWVFPWKIALVAVLVIVAVILFVLYWRKRQNALKDANKKTEE